MRRPTTRSTPTGTLLPSTTLCRSIEAMSEQLAGHDVALSYRVDPELHRVIVEVVDRKDGSVLRQITGEEAVRLARMMNSGQGGLLQATRSEEHTSELQSLLRNSYAVSCLTQTHKPLTTTLHI